MFRSSNEFIMFFAEQKKTFHMSESDPLHTHTHQQSIYIIHMLCCLFFPSPNETMERMELCKSTLTICNRSHSSCMKCLFGGEAIYFVAARSNSFAYQKICVLNIHMDSIQQHEIAGVVCMSTIAFSLYRLQHDAVNIFTISTMDTMNMYTSTTTPHNGWCVLHSGHRLHVCISL